MNTQQFVQHFENTFDENGRRLILEFFISFSRFEFALKAENFVLGVDRINADWDRFIGSIIFNPNATPELQDAVEYILQNPPKVQSIRNNVIVWNDRIFSPNTSDVLKLRYHITDIRNNLFHGGKFNGTFEPENSRNYQLVNGALQILNNWLTLDQNVHHQFSRHIN